MRLFIPRFTTKKVLLGQRFFRKSIHHSCKKFLLPAATTNFWGRSCRLLSKVLILPVMTLSFPSPVRRPTKHICICLTPTRYLWSHHKTYFKGQTFKGIARPFVEYLRKWDKIAASRPDTLVSISNE